MKEKLKSARKINLAAGILDIIVGGVAVIGLILSIVTIAGIGGELAAYPEVVGILVLSIIIAAAEVGCLLGFGIATVCYGSKPDEEYKKKKGKFLAFVIIETILVVFAIVGIVTSFSVTSVITLLIMIAVMILRWIGYAFVKQVAESGETTEVLETAKVEKPVEKPVENKLDVDKIQKLVELKNSGAISEEEYEYLKKKELGL